MHVSHNNNPFTNKKFFKNKKLIVMSSEEHLPLPNHKLNGKNAEWQPSESVVLQQTVKKPIEDEALDPSQFMNKSPTETNQLKGQPGLQNRKLVQKIGNEVPQRDQVNLGQSFSKKIAEKASRERGYTLYKPGADQRSDDFMSAFNSRLTNQEDAEIEKITAKDHPVNKADIEKYQDVDGLLKFKDKKQTLALIQLDSPKFTDTVKMIDRHLMNPKESQS